MEVGTRLFSRVDRGRQFGTVHLKNIVAN